MRHQGRVLVLSKSMPLKSKGFEGLSNLVKHQFKEDPLSGHLFIFANRKRNRVKLLYSDTTRTWLCAKRLYQGCYAWPKTDETGALRVLEEELTLRRAGGCCPH